MGREVTVTLICDFCKKAIEERNAVSGELAAARRRFSLHLHRSCLDTLTAKAELVPRRRKRGRPKGSTNKRKATTAA